LGLGLKFNQGNVGEKRQHGKIHIYYLAATANIFGFVSSTERVFRFDVSL
jgi:hypothetical protein